MSASIKIRKISGDEASEYANLSLVSEALNPKFLSEYNYDMMKSFDSKKPLAHTKDISEVAATGKKPFKQKGTGSARQGSKVSAQHVGGGVAHGPRAKRVTVKINSKTTKKAKRMGIENHILNNSIFIIDSLIFDECKTKNALNLLSKLNIKIGERILFLSIDGKNSNFYKSVRNIENVRIYNPLSFSVHEIFKAKKLIISSDALSQLNVVLSK